MRKLAIALVAITVGATLPAAAQIGFYAGPGGIGVSLARLGTMTTARIITTATSITGVTNTSFAAGRESDSGAKAGPRHGGAR
jgi:hypothetical protein